MSTEKILEKYLVELFNKKENTPSEIKNTHSISGVFRLLNSKGIKD